MRVDSAYLAPLHAAINPNDPLCTPLHAEIDTDDPLCTPLHAEVDANLRLGASLHAEIDTDDPLCASLHAEVETDDPLCAPLHAEVETDDPLFTPLHAEIDLNALLSTALHAEVLLHVRGRTFLCQFSCLPPHSWSTLRRMDNPRDDTSSDLYLTRGSFTIGAVRADPETKGLEVSFAAIHAQLKTKVRQVDDLAESVEEHEAILVVRDRALDKVVRSFELWLLDLVGRNREDLRYRRYFASGLRAVTEADARTVEPKLVRDMIKTLGEDKTKPGFETLHGEFGNRLTIAVVAVETADLALAQVETQWDFERDKALAEIKFKWIEERKKLHADLTKLFPHDPARVESYFQRFAKPRKKKTE